MRVPTARVTAKEALHRNDNGNGNVRGGPAPTLGKETLYRTETAAGEVADDAQHCHKQGCNKRGRPKHQAELQRDRG
jgi:hypothetical protein